MADRPTGLSVRSRARAAEAQLRWRRAFQKASSAASGGNRFAGVDPMDEFSFI